MEVAQINYLQHKRELILVFNLKKRNEEISRSTCLELIFDFDCVYTMPILAIVQRNDSYL